MPPDDATLFHRLLADARERDDPTARFLQGGIWRAFQARYREINDLHKQMLRVSAKVAAMPPSAARERALDHLYRGQSNDVYWHGLFGGVYLPDLRVAALSELIAAEDLADGGRIATVRADLDLDGLDEVLLGGSGQSLLVDLAEGAGIGAWDLLATRVPLASVLRRRPEATHAQLFQEAASAGTAPTAPAATVGDPAGPTSPHATLAAKETGLAQYLVYDRHERRSGLVHLRDASGSTSLGPAELAAEAGEELADLVEGAYEITELSAGRLAASRRCSLAGPHGSVPLLVTKAFHLGGDRRSPVLEVAVTLEASVAGPLQVELDLEWNLDLLGGGGNPQAWYEVGVADPRASQTRTPHDGRGDHESIERVAFGNDWLGVAVTLIPRTACRATWFPVETVSSSEAGFERVYQGSSLHLRWPVTLGDGPAGVAVRLEVHQDRDLAEG
jgi:alpha-amylase